MEKLKRVEFVILIILWVSSLTTYTIALLNNYVLYVSDYFGLVGLIVVTVISYFKPEKTLLSVFILLLFGLFNLVSFIYFVNFVFAFGISGFITPGIQVFSLILLSILIVKKQKRVVELLRKIFGRTEEEKEQSKQNVKKYFKGKFEKLTDKEIEVKLQEDLVTEAMDALNEIKEERSKTEDNYQ